MEYKWNRKVNTKRLIETNQMVCLMNKIGEEMTKRQGKRERQSKREKCRSANP